MGALTALLTAFWPLLYTATTRIFQCFVPSPGAQAAGNGVNQLMSQQALPDKQV